MFSTFPGFTYQYGCEELDSKSIISSSLVMDSKAEERLLHFLRQRLTEEQANKFSVAERQFLLEKAFDDVDALKMATLAQLVEPPGDPGCVWILSNPCQKPDPMSHTPGGQGGLRAGIANMLLVAYGIDFARFCIGAQTLSEG